MVALRRWLVCVAGLRLMSGRPPLPPFPPHLDLAVHEACTSAK